MTKVVQNGFFVLARKDGVPGVYQTLEVAVTVNNRILATAVDGFDGDEKPYVLLPYMENRDIAWQKVPLRRDGAPTVDPVTGDVLDNYVMKIGPPQDPDGTRAETAADHGVQVVLDTNVGPIHAQPEGQTYPVLSTNFPMAAKETP